MKKCLKLFFVSAFLVSILSILTYASSPTSYTFYYNDREVTIESFYLDEEEAQSIADYIVFGITPVGYIEIGNQINTSFLCTLFGHSIETYTAQETIHFAYSTSPKCVINIYRVECCTRSSCDYIEKTLIDSTRTAMCHG